MEEEGRNEHLFAAPARTTEPSEDLIGEQKNIKAPFQWMRYRYLLVVLLVVSGFLNAPLMSVEAIPMSEQFHWTKAYQGTVHSAFFYGFASTQLVGGMIADKFGGRYVLALGILGMGVFLALHPPAASYPALLIAIRIGMGLLEGVQGPATNNLIAHWVPLNERSISLALIRGGMFMGSIFAFVASPYLMIMINWQFVWFLFAGLAGLWCLVFLPTAASSPAQHAGISAAERTEIEDSTETEFAEKIPFLNILSSPAVWGLFVAHFCHDWGWFMIVNWLPTYLHELGVDHATAGMYSALPFTIMLPASILSGIAADWLISHAGYSVKNVRRAFSGVALLGTGLVYLGAQMVTLSAQQALAFVSVAFALDSLNVGGYMINSVDIAPRFAGTVRGMGDTLGCIAGVLSNTLTGFMLSEAQLDPAHAHGNFRTTFLVSCAINAAGCVAFVALAQGTPLRSLSQE